MKDHIVGLEMEYSLVSQYSWLDNAQVVGRFIETAKESLPDYARHTEFFLAAGRIYNDRGHLERASPECRSARQMVTYDKAGDRFIAQIAAKTERQLKQEGYTGHLEIAKTTVDPGAEHTFGCHENYQIERKVALLANEKESQQYLFRCLFPFLVSRSIICGSGLHDGQSFCLSQRPRFIHKPVSASTIDPSSRSIINTKDEPLGDGSHFRRLHLIMGDANLTDWANFLKVGTTLLVLEMVEDCYFTDVPLLEDPVAAFHTIAQDPGIAQPERTEITARVPLCNGKNVTALELQHYYLEAAKTYYSADDAEAQEIIRRWEQTLEDLGRASQVLFDLLIGKLDWVTKKWMLQELCNNHLHGWYDERCAVDDYRYHVIYPTTSDKSIFYLLERQKIMVPLITADELKYASHYPPHFTRARARTEALLGGATNIKWENIAIPGYGPANWLNAFDWCPVADLRRLDVCSNEFLKWFDESLRIGNVAVRVETLQKLSELPANARNVSGIIRLARQGLDDHEPAVRTAAVDVLRKLGTAQAQEALKQTLDDADPLVRLHATRT